VGSPAKWPPLTRLLDGLNTVVMLVTEAAMRQVVQERQATLEANDERSLRKHLREEMKAITQVAQALRRTVPGIGVIRMPSDRMQAEGLLKAADALGKLASPYEAVLVEHGATPDFRVQLGDASSALKASIDARGAARASQVSATKEVAENIALGRRYLALMDAALTKALRSRPAKLAEWKNAKRVTIKGVPQPDTTGTSAPAEAPERDVRAA
jgi:hypothetical protein